jgi:hypothetical protein
MVYQHRILESSVKEYLTLFPVLGITGPRQSGKSTLLKQLLHDYQYVTFDDPQIQAFLQEDPQKFIQAYSEKVIFDEVQKVPELFPLIKLTIDRERGMYGRFVLTGSSQFSMIQTITDSLAGRIGLLSLLPFQYQEMPKEMGRQQAIYSGSYPELILRDYQGKLAWYGSYLETYLHRDVKTLAQVGDLADFHRLLRLLAAYVGQQLNLSQLATDIGVSVQTIRRWISILEASYIIFLLPPFYQNYGKRLIKKPKLYFWDNGLVAYLLGIQTQEHYATSPMQGALFENYVVSDIAKNIKHRHQDAELYYYRTQHGAEVDLIIDHKTHVDWIEIKSTATFRPKLLKQLIDLKKPSDQAFLLYQGEPFPYPGVQVLHFTKYLNPSQKEYTQSISSCG